jgi:hypothetical protein
MYLHRRQFLQLTAALAIIPSCVIASPQVNTDLKHIGIYVAVAFDYNTIKNTRLASDISNAALIERAAYHDIANQLYWLKVSAGTEVVIKNNSPCIKTTIRGSTRISSLANIIVSCSSGRIWYFEKNRSNSQVTVPEVLHLASFKTVQFNWNENITRII